MGNNKVTINLNNTRNTGLIFTPKGAIKQGTHHKPWITRYFVQRFMPNKLSQLIFMSLHIKIQDVSKNIWFGGKVMVWKRKKRLAVVCDEQAGNKYIHGRKKVSSSLTSGEVKSTHPSMGVIPNCICLLTELNNCTFFARGSLVLLVYPGQLVYPALEFKERRYSFHFPLTSHLNV